MLKQSLKWFVFCFTTITLFAVNGIHSYSNITNPLLPIKPQLYILESEHSEGKYVNSDILKTGFKPYYSKQLPREKPVHDRMYTLSGFFLLDASLSNTTLSCYIGPTKYPYNVYLNGKIVSKKGTHTSSYDTSVYHSSDVYLSRDLLNFGNITNSIGIEIFTGYEIFPFEGLTISSYQENSARAFWRDFYYVFIAQTSFILALIIGLFFLFNFFTRNYKDIRYIYFALFCFFFALARINFTFSHNSVDELLIEKFSKVGFPLTISFLTLFILEYTGILSRNWLIKLIALLPSTLLACVIAFKDTKVGIESVFSLSMLFIVAPLSLFNLSILALSIWKKNKTSIVLLTAHLLLFGASLHDIIFLKNQWMPYAWLTAYGYIALLVSIFFLLAWEQSIMYLALRKTTAELQVLNNDLDIKIEDRTRELNIERNLLQKKNEVMENELAMARIIQSQCIPNKSPLPNISFFYKSVDRVGGNFLDFISFSDNSWQGIFISGVSGHGVEAAFITTMIKSALNQTRDTQDNPSSLLHTLNKSLYNQTGGNQVKAFYGLFIPEAQKFCFANAGHNQPLLIEDGIINQLHKESASLPLAVLDTQDMLLGNKSYTNYTIQLKKGSKLVLFTDSLLEAAPGRDVELAFENGPLNQVMLENANKTASEFVHNVYQKLVEIYGSEQFEDDVCLICLDV